MRNRLFALSALFDVLELRADGSAAIARYLPHLRLELSRFEKFAADWKEDALADPVDAQPAGLTDVLARAIERVSEDAVLRDVYLSLVCEPDSRRTVQRPELVTATLALLLAETVRDVAPGTHVWLRAARTSRGETTVELWARDAVVLLGTGAELARATLRSLGGDLLPGDVPHGDGDVPLAVVRLGAYA